MKIQWKTYLDEIKRVYNSIFETRDVEDIRKDYYDKKWISKIELKRLMDYEISQLVEVVVTAQKEATDANAQYVDLLRYFDLNSMRNYEHLEKKFQGLIKN